MKDTRIIITPETPEKLQAQRMPNGAVVDFDFVEFVRFLLDNCQDFNRDAKGIKASLRIEDALGAEGDAATIVLREEDWQLLQKVAQAPGVQYPTKPARLCAPYLDAIEDAKREE